MGACPMCAIAQGKPEAHKTEWFYHSRLATVVEDLNSKGYAIRLLGVPQRHFHCRAIGDPIPEIRQRVIEIKV